MHKLFEVAVPALLLTVVLTIAPTRHQPTIGVLALGAAVCILVPTYTRRYK